MSDWSYRTALAVCLLLSSFAYGQNTNGVKLSAEYAAAANVREARAPDEVGRMQRATAFAQLKAKAVQNGRVRVIVHVAVDRIAALTAASTTARTAPVAVQADARLADSISKGAQRETAKLAGVQHEVSHTYKSIPFVAMSVSEEALQRLEASPGVIGIEEDRLARPNLNNTVNIVGASAAWAGGLDGSGWYVAVLDTGIRASHEFFGRKDIVQACFATGESGGDCPNGLNADTTSPNAAEPYPSSWAGYDHGTHVSGIAVGNGPSVPAAGVAKGANLINIKVFFRCTGCCDGSDCLLAQTSDQIAGQDFVYGLRFTYNIAAVNLSLGGGLFSDQASCDAANSAQKASIDTLRSAGIATVIATGNGASCTGISSPACISSAIAVGGSDDSDAEYGGNNWHPELADLFAPGVAVLSSTATSNSSYSSWSGTSMATPHVAGAWAILRQAEPSAGVTEVFNALSQSGQTISGGCGAPVPQKRIQIDGAINFFGFDACCQQDDTVCTDITAEDCTLLGGKTRPGHYCAEIPNPCEEDVKFSQPASIDGEDIASNIDSSDDIPNAVVADDFTSDGRPIRTVRWWGSDIGARLDEYRVDDGTHETSVGFTGGGDVIWLNQFNVIAGLETITTVSLAWGTVPDGTATTVMIYDDPNNDGDPTDAVLLTSHPTTSANRDTDTFTLVDVTDTVVGAAGDSFFVGAYITHGPARFPASLDQSPSLGRSWIVGDDQGGADINDLTNNDLPPILIDAVDLPGNWLIRADAGPEPVDEPDGWFISFHEPLSEASPPAPPLGLYYCDTSIVQQQVTGLPSCDDHPVNEYRADLGDCCLVDANPDSRSLNTPALADGFLEERCTDYAIDIQAIIGHRFEDDGGGGCNKVVTGLSNDGEFWGWHTAPDSVGAPYGLGPALTSTVTMAPPDWLYGPWSAVAPVCSTSNMAFELITDVIGYGDPDEDGDGYPDSCTCETVNGALADPSGSPQSRYLAFSVLDAMGVGARQAIQIELIDLLGFPSGNTRKLWVGPLREYPDEYTDQPGLTFGGCGLSCEPVFTDWSTVGLLQVFGGEIVPESRYAVRIVEDCCEDLDDPSCYSTPLIIDTGVWGDIWPPFQGDPGAPPEPDFNDIAAMVRKFQEFSDTPIKPVAQLQPNTALPDRHIDFKDIAANVAAFVANPYSNYGGITGPCLCPSTVTCGATACVSDVACSGGYCIDNFCTDECGRCAP